MRCNPETCLRFFLRLIGTSSLLAFFPIFFPYSWMNAIHQWCGLGTLPAEPVVGYLARSTSGFYALLGGLLWVLSFDLPRYRLVLDYLGSAIVFFGLVLLGVDFIEGLPTWWMMGEGPLDALFGLAILILNQRLRRADTRKPR